MLRTNLTPDDREALQALRRDPTLTPTDRDRVEMVLLNADGTPALRIAAFLQYHPVTVRAVLTRFRPTGTAGLRTKRTGPPPDTAHREHIEAALRALLAEDRTWTAGQLAEVLRERGIALAARTVRRYLAGLRAGYHRTVRSLDHQQDPAKVAAATAELAGFTNGPKRAS